MSNKIFNDMGKELTASPEYEDPAFGTYHPALGYPMPYWDKYQDLNVSDKKGFDIRKLFPKSGTYKVRRILPAGKVVCRYGSPIKGYYIAPDGTDYAKVGLPYKRETIEFHRYLLKEPLEVWVGFVAPVFNSDGGAVQYVLDDSVQELLNMKAVEELPGKV